MWERFSAWSERTHWNAVIAYVVALVVVLYVINDIYGIIDTPAVNEVRREITKKGVVNEHEVKAIVRREVRRLLADEGLVEDPRGAGNGQGGGSSTGSAPPSQPGPSGNEGSSDNGGSAGGGSTPAPNPPPSQPPVQVPNLPNVVQEVCNTLPQVQLPPVCP
jgi:uncharacterized membrane protein YgcG